MLPAAGPEQQGRPPQVRPGAGSGPSPGDTPTRPGTARRRPRDRARRITLAKARSRTEARGAGRRASTRVGGVRSQWRCVTHRRITVQVMLADHLPLARSTIDRDAAARSREGLLAELWASSSSRLVRVREGQVALTAGGRLDLCAPEDFAAQPTGAVAYLGKDHEGAYLAHWEAPTPSAHSEAREDTPQASPPSLLEVAWRGLRNVGATLSPRDVGLATAAVALAAWRSRHLRCPRCGAATLLVDAGWVARCPDDGSTHYPRTDPAVIMAVTDDDDRLLLGHAATWPDRRFSTLAGFVEPGESLEAAVRREVAEEVSLTVSSAQYAGSQPWPFPASLMVGFRASVSGRGSEVIPLVDGVEVTQAQWLTRDELADQVAGGELIPPSKASIARALIEDWLGQALPFE